MLKKVLPILMLFISMSQLMLVGQEKPKYTEIKLIKKGIDKYCDSEDKKENEKEWLVSRKHK